jgi:hypothetical protein
MRSRLHTFIATAAVGVLLLGASAPAWAQTAGSGQALSLGTLSTPPAESSQPAATTQEETEAEGQDATTKAMDSTATQWSFQFSYQNMPDYHQDTMDNGETRPVGADDYIQFRVVAPVPLKHITILPRVTFRHYQNAQGDSGIGNTEIFALIIPKAFDWGSGRTGIGPLITVPGNEKVARDEWGYGFAAAVVNSSGPWFYGLLITQSWQSIDPTALPPGGSNTNPLGISPFLNFRFGTSGWYIGNGDMVALYDWTNKKFYMPIGVRFGKVLVKDYGSWNIYGEYQTSLFYKSYLGPAVKNSFRMNLSFTIPM